MTNKEIALHLIQEDIKYHELVKHLAEVDVYIEFYPDIATAVQGLIAPDLSEMEQQEWTDWYVRLMRERTENTPHKDPLADIPKELLN